MVEKRKTQRERVRARGVRLWKPRLLILLSVYDGCKVGVRRVLAGSSFPAIFDLIGDPCAVKEETMRLDSRYLRRMDVFFANYINWLSYPDVQK